MNSCGKYALYGKPEANEDGLAAVDTNVFSIKFNDLEKRE